MTMVRFMVPIPALVFLVALVFLALACTSARSPYDLSPEAIENIGTEAAAFSEDARRQTQATNAAIPTSALWPAYTPRPTATEVPRPTATLRPTPTPSVSPSRGPGAVMDKQEKERFVAQQTRIAPTIQAIATIAPTVVNMEGKHGQWILSSAAYPPEAMSQSGIIGSRSVGANSGMGVHQYTCFVYADGREVPRINVFYNKELTYALMTNDAGEIQGKVKTVTTVDGTPVPAEWRTWASRADRIRLRGDDAIRLVKGIRDRNATELGLELVDNPELSSTFNVADLVDAMNMIGMACFK